MASGVLFALFLGGYALSQAQKSAGKPHLEMSAPEKVDDEISSLEAFADYAKYKADNDKSSQKKPKLTIAQVDPSSQKEPNQFSVTSPEKGTLCYLVTSSENAESKKARKIAVDALVAKRQFAQALKAEMNAPMDTTSLWVRRFDSASDASGHTEVFRFGQGGSNVWGTPHLSPDRKKVALLYSNDDSNGGFTLSDLLIVNLDGSSVEQYKCGDGINYDQASWSPDGRYLAFFVGGLDNGEVQTTLGNDEVYFPLELWILDAGAKKVSKVLKNDSIRGPLNWVAPHTLLYGVLSSTQKGKPERSKDSGEEAPTSSQLNVQSYNPEQEEFSLLLKDAYLPTPSKDGQWIAFFGSEDVTEPTPLQEGWRFAPQGISLCVSKFDGSQRRSLDLVRGLYPQSFWGKDNDQLISLDEIYAR